MVNFFSIGSHGTKYLFAYQSSKHPLQKKKLYENMIFTETFPNLVQCDKTYFDQKPQVILTNSIVALQLMQITENILQY